MSTFTDSWCTKIHDFCRLKFTKKIPRVTLLAPLGGRGRPLPRPTPRMAYGFAPPNVDASCLTCVENVAPPLPTLLQCVCLSRLMLSRVWPRLSVCLWHMSGVSRTSLWRRRWRHGWRHWWRAWRCWFVVERSSYPSRSWCTAGLLCRTWYLRTPTYQLLLTYTLCLTHCSWTGVSANADGPRDAALHKIDHIVLHAECN